MSEELETNDAYGVVSSLEKEIRALVDSHYADEFLPENEEAHRMEREIATKIAEGCAPESIDDVWGLRLDLDHIISAALKEKVREMEKHNDNSLEIEELEKKPYGVSEDILMELISVLAQRLKIAETALNTKMDASKTLNPGG